MEKVIYKYVLDFDRNGVGEIETPANSSLLKVGIQNDKIVLWYLINKEIEPIRTIKTSFRVIMTGEEFDDAGMEYIDTVTLKDWLVCHLFRVK